LGWEAAFSKTFGRSVEQFYKEFNIFMDQPDEEIIDFLVAEGMKELTD
jgi:hypothetical protein